MKDELSVKIFGRALKELNSEEYQSLELLNSFFGWLGIPDLEFLEKYRKNQEVENLIKYIVKDDIMIIQKIKNVYKIYQDYYIYFKRKYNKNEYAFSSSTYKKILSLIQNSL